MKPRKTDEQRAWSKCKACGSSRVTTFVCPALEDGKECVIIECAACENRRGRYYRKKQPKGSE